MSSPVINLFKNILSSERQSGQALYLQIAHQIMNAIQRGILAAEVQLPGTRVLSGLLNVHRKTIVAAYDELLAQGWIEIIPNKGTFVAGKLPNKKPRELPPKGNALIGYPQQTGYYFSSNRLLERTDNIVKQRLEFTDGQPDIRLAPLEKLAKIYGGILKRNTNRKYIGLTDSEGNEYYREMLALFLNNTRGLPVTAGNIITTRGTDMALYLTSNILINEGDRVIVGELSFYNTNMIFQQAGAKLVSVPVDKHGISTNAIKQICRQKKIRLLYLTPHHHYPTTVTLSTERRLELLELSEQYGFIILEDDYDYDFHYHSSPLLPLASADTAGMIVYIGSFCKALAPGFRAGYIVAPENLIRELSKLRQIIDRQGDLLMEQALSELLREGEIQRHIKKAQKVYHERRDLYCALLENNFEGLIDFNKPQGGLAVWVNWNNKINLLATSKACTKAGLHLPQTLLYQTEKLTATRLGFGNFEKEEMMEAVDILKKKLVFT